MTITGAQSALATTITLVTGAFWGIYWWPVRLLEEAGLQGAWGTVLITLCAFGLLLPVVLWRGQLWRSGRAEVAFLMLGGAAFALYSVGFVYGRVAVIILLWFLTPVWSVVIGRVVMGWPVSRLRLAAIVAGVAGLALMLGAAEGDWPVPRGAGEWMAVAAGLFWSVATTGMRVSPPVPPIEAGLVFAFGAVLAALAVALGFGAGIGAGFGAEDAVLPAMPGREAWAVALAAGGVWWALSIAALMWATVRLEPARVGILLMAEALVGAATAALWAGEHLSSSEMAGGALVLLAGVLEVWPTRPVAAESA